MLEQYQATSRENRLAIGLSHDPAVVEAAEWLLYQNPPDGREPSDNLREYLGYVYGVEQEIIDAAIDIAELRIVESFKDG